MTPDYEKQKQKRKERRKAKEEKERLAVEKRKGRSGRVRDKASARANDRGSSRSSLRKWTPPRSHVSSDQEQEQDIEQLLSVFGTSSRPSSKGNGGWAEGSAVFPPSAGSSVSSSSRHGARRRYAPLLSASASLLSEPGVGPRSVLTPMAASASAEVLPTYASTMRYVRTADKRGDGRRFPEPLSTSHSYSSLRDVSSSEVGFSGLNLLEGGGRIYEPASQTRLALEKRRRSVLPAFPWVRARTQERYRIKPASVVAEIKKYERALRGVAAPFSLARYEVDEEDEWEAEEEDEYETDVDDEEGEVENGRMASFPSWARKAIVSAVMNADNDEDEMI